MPAFLLYKPKSVYIQMGGSMKGIILGVALLASTNAFAVIDGYCNQTVESTVQALVAGDYQLVPQSISSQAVSYVGFHTKKYEIQVSFENEASRNYEAVVFEFETPGTTCEISSVQRVF